MEIIFQSSSKATFKTNRAQTKFHFKQLHGEKKAFVLLQSKHLSFFELTFRHAYSKGRLRGSVFTTRRLSIFHPNYDQPVHQLYAITDKPRKKVTSDSTTASLKPFTLLFTSFIYNNSLHQLHRAQEYPLQYPFLILKSHVTLEQAPL